MEKRRAPSGENLCAIHFLRSQEFHHLFKTLINTISREMFKKKFFSKSRN